MRPSVSLLHNIETITSRQAPRLRERLQASQILENVQTLKHQQSEQITNSVIADAVTDSDIPVSQGNPFFLQLPKPLAEFFTKYPPAPFRQYAEKSTSTDATDANPFIANRHPITKRLHDPIYSHRRQSDLYKAAYRYGITHLLPPLANGKKFYEDKYENKTPVRGSHRFKLSKAERKAPERKQEMADALAKADEIIAKARGAKFRRRLEAKQKKGLPWF